MDDTDERFEATILSMGPRAFALALQRASDECAALAPVVVTYDTRRPFADEDSLLLAWRAAVAQSYEQQVREVQVREVQQQPQELPQAGA